MLGIVLITIGSIVFFVYFGWKYINYKKMMNKFENQTFDELCNSGEEKNENNNIKVTENKKSKLSKTMILALIFFGLQIVSLAGQYAEVYLNQGMEISGAVGHSIGNSIGGNIFVIIGAILSYKAYKDK